MPTTRRATAIANAEKTQHACMKCKNPNHVDKMIACDHCHRWYHRACVKVADTVETRKWTCEDCILTTTIGDASISGRTSSTSRSTRIQLQLMRLEEEKKSPRKVDFGATGTRTSSSGENDGSKGRTGQEIH